LSDSIENIWQNVKTKLTVLV